MREKIVLAYSGGLDTSVAIRWLNENKKLDVVTLTVDLGQAEDLKAIKEKSGQIGAINHYTVNAEREFIEDYVFPAIKANALYENKYPISTALARPLIAQKLVEAAHKEGATAVAHGCTGKGNDQVRFEVAIRSLDHGLKIVAPMREWNLSREEEIAYAEKHGIPVPADLDNPYSVDQNLWGRSIECGILEDPTAEPPPEIYEWTSSPEHAPEKPAYVTIQFDNGIPVAVNDRSMGPVEIVKELNLIAGKHGIGRIDHLEDRLVGIKSREIYECPAATLLIEAHRELEKSVLTRHEVWFKEIIDSEWARLAYTGLWNDPFKEDLDAFIEKTQERVTGKVKLKLYKGSAQVVSRSSPLSLYDTDLATYSGSSTFDQGWSEGFIQIWGMPTVVANIRKRQSQGRIVKQLVQHEAPLQTK
ncbi:MAG TPA: argininosuccinate synthase [Candidatus Bathyarchaeia archaeon]|jgi:argininosuccinate synthase|nr:argininosuccinate synthase [Candidatus Bathyarchaeia archaeon]